MQATSPGRRRGPAAPLAFALLAGLAACVDGDPRTLPGTGEPVRGGTLVIGGHMDLRAANPLAVSESFNAEFLQHVLLMTLVRSDRDLQPEPYLAESWEFHGDTAVTFRIRRDIAWHDGVSTTAHDVAFTYERAKQPETAFVNREEYFGFWGGHEVIDSFTIRFRLEPHSEPLSGWVQMPIAPRHLLASVPPAELAQAPFAREPVGNGPFRFVSQRANDQWVFEANPDFPDALGGRPNVDRLVWRVIPETTARLTALQTGAAHLITNMPSDRWSVVDADPRLRAIQRESRVFAFVGWNGQRPPFDDARVRRALSTAIDRQGILDGLRAGLGTLALGPVGPFHWAFADTFEPLPHDPAAARALLLEAGFREGPDGVLIGPGGRPFGFTLSIAAGNEFNMNVAEMMRADFARIGVRMTTRPLEGGTLIADVSSPERRFEAVLLALEGGLRLDLRSQFHSEHIGGGFQLASYSNPEVDELLTRANHEIDREAARPHWHRLQSILLDEQPWTFLFYYPELFAADVRLRGVEMDIRSRFRSLPRWWLDMGTVADAGSDR